MSLAVLTTFSSVSSLRKHEYNYVIIYIAFSDLCSSVGIAIGLQESGSVGCNLQTLLTNICPLWSIFWTTTIALYVVKLAVETNNNRSEPQKIYLQTHLVIWILPVVLTLLILTTNSFGCPESNSTCWCFVGQRQDSPHWTMQFWYYVSKIFFNDFFTTL